MSILDKKCYLTANISTSKVEGNTISFYNTDKNTSILYLKLKYVDEFNLEKYVTSTMLNDYSLKLVVVKPKTIELVEMLGVKENDMFKFELPSNFTDQVGNCACELIMSNTEEDLTFDEFAYEVKASATTKFNAEIIANPDLPILKALIAEVRELIESMGSGTNHVHTNKTELDAITQEKIILWDGVINKVDKVTGKQLSTEDYTTSEKQKLSNIDTSLLQAKNDNTLDTFDKTVVGAINELNTNKADKTEVLLSSKLNDNGTGTDELWSASKVNAQFNTIINSGIGGLIFEDIEDGEVFTSIVVSYPCTSISLSNSTLTFTNTATQTLTTTVLPSNCTDVVSWSSSDTTVATVSNGIVTPLKNGSCNITVTCGNYSATCNITISGIETSYSVTNNLINCSNSNINTSVLENASYSATITVNENYKLGIPVITMGGIDITSTVYSDGVITISNVTGNIVIICNASLVATGLGVIVTKETISEKDYLVFNDVNYVQTTSNSFAIGANTYKNDAYQMYSVIPAINNLWNKTTDYPLGDMFPLSTATSQSGCLIDAQEGDLCLKLSGEVYLRLPLNLNGCTTVSEYLQSTYGKMKFALSDSYNTKEINPNLITNISIKTNDLTCQYAQFGYSDLPSTNIYAGACSLCGITGSNVNLSGETPPRACIGTSVLSITFPAGTFTDFTLDNVKEYLTNNPLVFWYV